MLRQLFGRKSEKLDAAQLELLLEGLTPGKPPASSGDETSAPEEDNEKRRSRKRGANRSRITGLEQLPVETTEIIPDCVLANPEDFERCKSGEQITELLDIVPAKLFRRIIIRPKFRHKHQRELPPVVAPAPATPLLGGLPAVGLLVYLLVGKYVDHLPLYRLQQIFLRSRVGIPRDLIIHWIHQSIGLLMPVVEAIRRETLASNYLQVDETPVRYLSPGMGKAPQGYLWVANSPGGSLYYHWGVGRGREQLIECIGEEFAGDQQCDGHSAYNAYDKRSDPTGLLACLAHIRRPFLEALDTRTVVQVLGLIGALYGIEDELREKKAGPALRESERAWRSAPIVRRLGQIIRILLPKHRPQSPMGKALAYAWNHWDRFARYLEDGRFEIDNNLVENCMRPVKLGAKNWLFFGSKDAGHHAAAIYTLVENCKRQGVPVEAYLKHLLEVLPVTNDPEAIAALTPARIAAARSRNQVAA